MSCVTRAVAVVISVRVPQLGRSDPGANEQPIVRNGRADPTNARMVDEGGVLYAVHCLSCHGAALEGQPGWREPLPSGSHPAPLHDGNGHTGRHSDEELFEASKFGGDFSAAPDSISHISAFEHVLSDDEIWARLAFVKSHWPAELQARRRMLARLRSGRQQKAHTGHDGHDGQAGHADHSPE